MAGNDRKRIAIKEYQKKATEKKYKDLQSGEKQLPPTTSDDKSKWCKLLFDRREKKYWNEEKEKEFKILTEKLGYDDKVR